MLVEHIAVPIIARTIYDNYVDLEQPSRRPNAITIAAAA